MNSVSVCRDPFPYIQTRGKCPTMYEVSEFCNPLKNTSFLAIEKLVVVVSRSGTGKM